MDVCVSKDHPETQAEVDGEVLLVLVDSMVTRETWGCQVTKHDLSLQRSIYLLTGFSGFILIQLLKNYLLMKYSFKDYIKHTKA